MNKKIKTLEKAQKNKIFLQVGSPGYSYLKNQRKFFKKNHNLIFYVLVDLTVKKDKSLLNNLSSIYSHVIFCNMNSSIDIFKALIPFQKDIVAVSTSGDSTVKYLKKVVPLFPHLHNPTESSLNWSSNKNWMRKFFQAYSSEISPNFIELNDRSEKEIQRIEKNIDYPLMVKPTNMASSKFVTKCYHRKELEIALIKIYKKGNIVQRLRDNILQKNEKNFEVIVEEFMEGRMYSADGVIDNKGRVTIYPPVYVKTGKEIGFDDFFGYMQILPSKISDKNIQKMNIVIKKAIQALSLTNSHFHIELLKTDDHGWRVIEIAPRIGGFREFLYKNVYDFSLNKNNILNKIGKKIAIKKETLSSSAVLKIYAKKEGKIKKILGQRSLKENKSIVKINQKKKIGDRAQFAKNAGDPVFIIYLKNKERGTLLGDIRKIEEKLKIVI